MADIIIVPTSHIAEESIKRVSGVIEEENPQCIAVELDVNRFIAMEEGEASHWQAIRAMGVIANNGYLPTPHVLKEIHSPDGKITPYAITPSKKVISDRTCKILSEMLEKVVSPEGTAPLAYIPGYHTGGKTGTAQKVVNGRYSSSKVIASFIGYIYNNHSPKVLILVKVDEPHKLHYGGLIAAPVFRNIAWRIMYYWKIPPDKNLKKLKIALKEK